LTESKHTLDLQAREARQVNYWKNWAEEHQQCMIATHEEHVQMMLTALKGEFNSQLEKMAKGRTQEVNSLQMELGMLKVSYLVA